MKDIGEPAIASLPAVVDVGGVKVAIAESDIEDYPGLWLHGTGGNALAAVVPPYPLKKKIGRGRDPRGTAKADYISGTKRTRTVPWRNVGIAGHEADLPT